MEVNQEKTNIVNLLSRVPIFFDVNDEIATKVAISLLPVDTGIEIECHKKESFKNVYFQDIPDMVSVITDSGEQRYRIPSGLKGMICCYRLCDKLKEHSLLTNSGIHLHMGLYDLWDDLTPETMRENEDWILKELDSWNYPGTYNERRFNHGGSWIRPNSEFKTVEIRICEMTFDYSVLMERILHAHRILKRLKFELSTSLSSKKQLLQKLQESIQNELDMNLVNQIVRSRKIKI